MKTFIAFVLLLARVDFIVSQAHHEDDHVLKNCQDILRRDYRSADGVYHIISDNFIKYPVYCDMTTGGGGWTLVGSIHENNMAGKCTTGDRWSSEQGNTEAHPNGDGNWENHNIFGHVQAATMDDYKNMFFYEAKAKNIMIWQVPNNKPLSSYKQATYLQYRTVNDSLAKFGGNLHNLFKQYPIINGIFNKNFDNGPTMPVVFDKGNADDVLSHLGPATVTEVEAGFLQFRVVNHEQSVFAMCPGVRYLAGKSNKEHACIGGTSNHKGHQDVHKYCGDFSAFDWNGYGSKTYWSADVTLTESTFLIFYR